jgi:DMSO/TMAO reductase YedYZ molybdopterin-dependent catalytic subunit
MVRPHRGAVAAVKRRRASPTRLSRALRALPRWAMRTHPLQAVRALSRRALPAPPATWRRGPLREGAFTSPSRSTLLTTQVGTWLGITFAICFATGLISHFIQHPAGWFWWPTGPVWLYRVTQGLHVATGLATVPLLGLKLWAVYPKLFAWPPARTVAHAAERGSAALLVAAALFQIVTGVLNVARWYTPMGFFFTTAHYWTAWMAAGALLIHIAVQLPVIRGRAAPAPSPGAAAGRLTRRGLLFSAAGSAAVITLATIGQTVSPLSPVSLLGPRRPDQGPQGLPVNKSARAAGVQRDALDPDYRLTVVGPAGTRRLDLDQLRAMDQHTVMLPIACVEGWSATAAWTGVRMRDLAALVGVTAAARVTVESMQQVSRYRTSVLPANSVADPRTLLALEVHGQPLALDHGYPARLIAPDRPGVLQTKWVAVIRVEPV